MNESVLAVLVFMEKNPGLTFFAVSMAVVALSLYVVIVALRQRNDQK
jgi:hypothetical protein